VTSRYRAIAFNGYGEPEVLGPIELDVPEPGPGQVRLAVRAAGVNPWDWKVRSGATAAFAPVTFPHVPGIDVAGVVDAVGPGVTGLEVGDEVFGKAAGGSYADLALARANAVAVKPAGLPWELAAALPVAASTARHALDELAVTSGETLLVDGATGGVGTLVVQLARRLGATVLGTAGPANQEHLRSLGATPLVYGDGLADRVRAAAPQGVDAALDGTGHGALPILVELAGGPDRVVTLADPKAGELGVTFLGGEVPDLPAVLAQVGALAATGALTLPIAHAYPLAEAAAAHRASQSGHTRGKLVLIP
jgi:NADPH:quinone reductase-like Zn-dependent oxidoreductase